VVGDRRVWRQPCELAIDVVINKVSSNSEYSLFYLIHLPPDPSDTSNATKVLVYVCRKLMRALHYTGNMETGHNVTGHAVKRSLTQVAYTVYAVVNN